jgi:hypothetical protein
VGFEGAHLLARDRGGLTELEAAFLLNVCLLDDVHVALELCDFLSIRAVALNHEDGRPEKDHQDGRPEKDHRRLSSPPCHSSRSGLARPMQLRRERRLARLPRSVARTKALDIGGET